MKSNIKLHWYKISGEWCRIRLLFLLFIALLAGCATTPPAPVEDRSVGRSPASSRPTSPVSTSGNPHSSYPGEIHRVVSGDTLYGIAFKYDLDYLDLARWNNISPPYRIYVGQELQLSGVRSSSRVVMSPVPEESNPVNRGTSKPSVLPTKSTVASSESSAPTVAANAPKPSTSSSPKSDAEATVKFDSKVDSKPESKPAPNPPEVFETVPVAKADITETKPPEPPVKPETVKPAAPSSTSGGIVWQWPSSGPKLSGFVAGDQLRQGIDIGGRAGQPVLAAADGSVVYSGNGLLGYGELIIIKHNATFLSAYGYNRKRLVQEGQVVKAGQQVAEMGSSGANRDMLHFEIRKNGKPVNPVEYLPAR